MKKGSIIRSAVLSIICIAGCLLGGFFGGFISGSALLFLIAYLIGRYLSDKRQSQEDHINKIIVDLKNKVTHGSNY